MLLIRAGLLWVRRQPNTLVATQRM